MMKLRRVSEKFEKRSDFVVCQEIYVIMILVLRNVFYKKTTILRENGERKKKSSEITRAQKVLNFLYVFFLPLWLCDRWIIKETKRIIIMNFLHLLRLHKESFLQSNSKVCKFQRLMTFFFIKIHLMTF